MVVRQVSKGTILLRTLWCQLLLRPVLCMDNKNSNSNRGRGDVAKATLNPVVEGDDVGVIAVERTRAQVAAEAVADSSLAQPLPQEQVLMLLPNMRRESKRGRKRSVNASVS